MSELTPEIAADVVAACKEGAEEAADAISRSLDGEFTMSVGEAANYTADAAPDGFDGPGLAILMKFGDIGAVAMLPEAGGLLPDWYADPDPTGESKLSTLAQELSMLLVPDTLFAEDFQAARVADMNAALASAEVADDAGMVPLQLTAGDKTAQLSLVWPVAAPDGLLADGEEEAEEPVAEAPVAPPAAPAPAAPAMSFGEQRYEDFSQLPGYSRSLLRIQVPVRVVLATKKENVEDIVELASGTIIKFEKSCDEMLHLQIEDHPIAVGEAVKVGDKFGFRVNSMVLPDEHFKKVPARKTG